MMRFLPLIGLGVLAGLILLALVSIIVSSRMTPIDRERRRRRKIYTMGRMGDGWLTDVDGDMIRYAYSVNGVDYNTSQDVSALRNLVPADSSLIIGPVTFKYLVREPGNSIVVCEEWSGLRIRSRPVVLS